MSKRGLFDMTTCKDRSCHSNLLGVFSIIGVLAHVIFCCENHALAQITPDGTLGDNSSRITPNINIKGSAANRIDGGAIRGANLFHSFREFNIKESQRVYFANPTGISNILTRVTGSNVSNILGTLGVNGGANLFLINPNGIFFGQNARLDVAGSFVASTANSFVFGDGLKFSATNPQTPSALLTVNPSALFFNQLQASRIENKSIAPAGIDPAGFNASGLRVGDGKSLLLVGGNVIMDGGELNAYGGRVELGGLAAPGNVNLLFNGDNLSLKFPLNVTRASVSLTNQARVYVEAAGGGDIAINARNIDILGESRLSAGIAKGLDQPEATAGDITLNATGEIKVADSRSGILNLVGQNSKGNGGNITIDSGDFSLRDGTYLAASTSGVGNAGNVRVSAKNAISLAGNAGILSTVDEGGVGKGGNININATTLSLTDGAHLLTITRGASATQPAGQGDAGNINVLVTGAVDIAGKKNDFSSKISSNVETGTFGNGGNITIDSGDFSLRDSAQLQASTLGVGNAGNVRVSAKNAVDLAGNAAIFSTVEAGGKGKGGNININATTLSLTDGAQLLTTTRGASATQPAGQGDAGNVNVLVTGAVDIAGKKNGSFSGIRSNVETGTFGNGGSITIDSGDFSLSDGARLSALTSGVGNAGNVRVSAKNAVDLAGNVSILSTVEAGGKGKGGNININATTLSLTDGTQLLTITRGASATQPAGQGDAGNVNILVTGTVNITGEKNNFSSAIISYVETGTFGNGGSINIDSSDFSLSDGARLFASTSGVGNAGNIRINAKDAINVYGTSQQRRFSSALFTFTDSTSTGKGGNITINTNIFRLSDGALLDARTRNNQKGGDITVNANLFEALNGGQLTSTTSSNGRAGKITVNADEQVIIRGIDPSYSDRITKFPNNVLNIGANSGLFVSATGSGITGDIEINSPKITLDNQGKLNAESASGNGGNINLNSDFLLLRRNSQISTNAGTEKLGGNGGDININSRFIVAVPKENSDISANAFTGIGGRVDITTNGIFGILPQKSPNENSDITASSQLGVSGEVTINSPDTDPSRGLIQLPSNLVDASQQIAQGCTPRRGQNASSFIATGRGGLPQSPNEPLRGRAVITGWVDLPARATAITDKSSTASMTKSSDQIVEAQGWIADANGNIMLVAQSPQSFFIPSAMSCSQ
ncbi:MAG: filamentous hemagglutinin N-terminal domain-containing protein [Nostoc sp.]|uniref:two-partner secretion domain-containing protein n=1 Tax=Nostoc sp. TaxID=1180 RepID=UPI002FF7DF70